MHKLCRTLLALLVIGLIPITFAAKPNHSKTVITSDKLVVEELSNIATFTGSVVSKQADNTIKSDRMIAFYRPKEASNSDASSIRRIEVYGKVEIITPKERATGDWGYYEDNVFHLMGNITMYGDNTVMTGEEFIYNDKTGKSSLVGVGKNTANASRPATKPKLIFQPS